LGLYCPKQRGLTLFVMGLRFPRRPTRRKRGLFCPLNERIARQRAVAFNPETLSRVCRGFLENLVRYSSYVIITYMSSDFYSTSKNSPYNTAGMPRKRKRALPPLKLNEEPIGQRIARLRKERGFTQRELANKIGITQTSVSDYETSRLRLSDEMVVRLAISLDVSADIILGLKRNRKEAAPSNLRILKRLKKISSLPPQRRKALLKTIDMALEATEKSG
jgi:transcriptional regulator with XRE-family HTH domain